MWPGAGPRLLLGHAGGFCKEVWRPVVEELRGLGFPGEIFALDFRGHGASPPPEHPEDWQEFAADILNVVQKFPIGPAPIGIGHSMGGTAMVLAELDRPGTFSALILVEPTIFPPDSRPDLPESLSRLARRRTGEFPSREVAEAAIAAKKAFSTWDARALQGYIEGGLVQRDGRVELACPPHLEERVYQGARRNGAYDRLGALSLPVLVLASGRSREFPPGYLDDFTARIAGARGAIVADTTHFLPMERPDQVARMVSGFMASAAFYAPASRARKRLS